MDNRKKDAIEEEGRQSRIRKEERKTYKDGINDVALGAESSDGLSPAASSLLDDSVDLVLNETGGIGILVVGIGGGGLLSDGLSGSLLGGEVLDGGLLGLGLGSGVGVLDLGLSEEDVGIGSGALEDIRLGDDEEDL